MGSSAVVLVTNERFNYPVKNLRQIRKMRSANCTLCDKIEAPMENSSYKVLALLNIFSGVLSVASNLLVLIAIYNFSPLRKVSIFFILSLAVADFLVGLVMNPVYAWIFFVNATEENHPLRVAEHWLWLQAVVISTFTLTAVSIERYIAVTKCLHYLEIVTAKRCFKEYKTFLKEYRAPPKTCGSSRKERRSPPKTNNCRTPLKMYGSFLKNDRSSWKECSLVSDMHDVPPKVMAVLEDKAH